MNAKPNSQNEPVEILIAEDSPTQAEQLRHLLEQHHYRVTVANDGQQALELLGKHAPALVISDIVMPGMNGFEFCQRIKADPGRDNIPVMLLTSLSNAEDVLEGLASGADSFITKPYSEAYLISNVQQMLANKLLRKGERVRIGLEMHIGGKTRFVSADQQQMLTLLISTYEAAIHRNGELVEAQEELRSLNENLESLVEERTARISHLNEVLRSIRNVNQLIVTEKNRERLLQSACDELGRTRGFRGAWIVLTEGLPERIESAQAGFDETAFAELKCQFLRGELPVCCRGGQTQEEVVVTENRAGEYSDCCFADADSEAAVMTIGLGYESHPYGYLAVAVPREFAGDEDEKSLLREIAGDISFALHGIEAEDALQKSEQTLHAIFDSANEGILLADGETRKLLTANKALCSMLGYSLEELRDLSVKDIHLTHDMPRIDAKFEKLLGGESTPFSSVEVVRKDGSVVFADIDASPVDLEGRVHFLGIFRDITERKQAEEALHSSEIRYRRLFETAKDGILILDADTGRVVDVNPFLMELLGCSYLDFIGKKLWELDAFRDVAGSQAAFEKLQSEEYIRYEDLPLKASDGRLIDVEFVSNLYMVDHTRVIQCNIRDIRRQKQLAEEHEKMEERLRQSQKMEAIGQLAGGVAHDFNNILQAIIGYSQFLLENSDPKGESYEFAGEIARGAERAAGLTRQLLAFSRRQVLKLEELDLNEAVAGVMKMLGRVIGENIRLGFVPGHDLGCVRGDRGQIEQILMNLCVNARDAMPEGGELSIETKNTLIDEAFCKAQSWAAPGRYVLLTVADTGCGMDGETLSHLWEPFFTTKGVGKGTGLGLSTVHGIVKQHEGLIRVDSEPGKGTTFSVYLPVEDRPAASLGAKIVAPPRGGTETILVAEDEKNVQGLARRILESAGYTVLTADNGNEAIRVLDEHEGEIQLALLDLIMPELGGSAVHEYIAEFHSPVRVLFTSGYDPSATQIGSVWNAGLQLIQKPYAPADLLRAVRKLLDGK